MNEVVFLTDSYKAKIAGICTKFSLMLTKMPMREGVLSPTPLLGSGLGGHGMQANIYYLLCTPQQREKIIVFKKIKL